jgi:hypothetical protein
MTDDGEVKYESKSVRTIRGLEARTIAKWEKEGWELTDQTQALVRAEMTFRRVKPKRRLWVLAVAGGVLLIAVGSLITVGVLEAGNATPNTHVAAETTPKVATNTPKVASTPKTTAASTPAPAPAPALSEINAAQYLAMQWEAKFTYGGEVHWIMDRITTANPDGTFTFKIGATVKNAYGTDTNATIEGDVGGTNAAPTITDSILYTADGTVVNFNG